MAEHVKVLELDDEEYILGLANPLKIKYKDSKNILHDFEYDGNVPNNNANNSNTIDLSGGVYYATTAATASKVSNPLTIHTPAGDILYNGGSPDVEITIPGVFDISYNDLVALKNTNSLTPGMIYRIYDYETIVNYGWATSAGHNFDIMVTATDNCTLSEKAYACQNKYYNNIGGFVKELYKWEEIDNWLDTETSTESIPKNIMELADGSVIGFQKGTRSCEKDGIVKVTLLGTVTYDDEPTSIKGLGAALISKSDGSIISIDYGLNKNVYILNIPVGSRNVEYVVEFYAIGKKADLNGGSCGAKAEEFEGNYFKNHKLSAWELNYCLENDTTRFAWANANGKGVVYYMKDEYSNEAPYDFKNVKYGDYYTFDYLIGGVHYDGSTKYGNKCFCNKICSDLTDEVGTNKPGLPKIIFKNTNESSFCKFNKFSNNAWNISFGNGCYYNEFIGKCENIELGNDCYMNIFHEDCMDNKLYDGCTNNTFGNSCIGNQLNYRCSHNTFGNNCTNNHLGMDGDGECTHNIFGNYCSSNVLKSSCDFNEFGDYCQNNHLHLECVDNKFGYSCTNNTFASYCSRNKLSSNCVNNSFGVRCISNEFADYCEDNILGCAEDWTYQTDMSQISDGSCYGNIFGYKCTKNCLRDSCKYNVFAANCGIDTTKTDKKVGNKLGQQCEANMFGEYCTGNTFGDVCSYNHFKDYSQYNTLGSSCQSNEFGAVVSNCLFGDAVLRCKVGSRSTGCKISSSSAGITLLNSVKLIEFGEECNVNLYANSTSTSSYLQNYKIANGLSGNIEITGDSPRGRSYITNIAKNSTGVTIQKCLSDMQNLTTSYSDGMLTISF